MELADVTVTFSAERFGKYLILKLNNTYISVVSLQDHFGLNDTETEQLVERLDRRDKSKVPVRTIKRPD